MEYHILLNICFLKEHINRTAKEIAEAIEDVGGQINAFTGKEATCYYIKALDTHLELIIRYSYQICFLIVNFQKKKLKKKKV